MKKNFLNEKKSPYIGVWLMTHLFPKNFIFLFFILSNIALLLQRDPGSFDRFEFGVAAWAPIVFCVKPDKPFAYFAGFFSVK